MAIDSDVPADRPAEAISIPAMFAQAAPPTEPQPAPPAPAPADSPQQQPEIVVTARQPILAPDPIAAINEKSFAFSDAVDKALLGPISLAYKKTLPSPVRSGVHNFLYNIREPVVFANFVLQHKFGKAAETAARFAINTVAGVAGFFDIAKRRPFKLPRRSNGFANTLGFYGVPNGPFMYLPIVGPTTVRDLFGGAVDRLVLPFTYGKRITKPAAVIPLAVFGALDHRSEFDDTWTTLLDGAPNPYANARDFYLQRRQAEIDHLRGRDRGNYTPMSEPPKGPIKLRGTVITPPPTPAPAPAPAPAQN
jgi:phospholipid-binding lipoprotein MlaA